MLMNKIIFEKNIESVKKGVDVEIFNNATHL